MTITANVALGHTVPGSPRPHAEAARDIAERASAARKVMHVLTSLEVGGAEMVVLELLSHMPERASQTCVVTLRRRGPLAERVEALGVRVISLDVPTTGGALALALALARVVRRERPDIIHSHNSSPLVATALATLFTGGIRLVHTEHGRSSTESRAARIALRLAGRRADHIVAVSHDTAEWSRHRVGLPADRIIVIRNGVPSGPPPRARDPRRTHAITVARLEKVKDIGTMLRAIPAIAARVPGFHLHIFGDGGERRSLEALSESLGLTARVTFHGMSNDVRTALAQGDVFLSSSVSEGISLTILEAMSNGLPVVATAVGGTPELVTDGLNGRLVAAADVTAFAAAVADVLAEPATAQTMGRASRHRAETEFSMQAMVDGYRQLYEAP